MRNPTFCICENKDADQLRGNREADQRLCFRYIDSFCFVLIFVLRPGKQFFSHIETEPPIPGYYQYFWGEHR